MSCIITSYMNIPRTTDSSDTSIVQNDSIGGRLPQIHQYELDPERKVRPGTTVTQFGRIRAVAVTEASANFFHLTTALGLSV
ncbi:MAG: hypothetical protein ACE361_04175 [Aureliella sp.]